MARNLEPRCRQCRREGEKLFLKGDRCLSDKCSISRRAYAPGQHGQKSGQKTSEYSTQLREKQKVRRLFGLMEKQFRKTFFSAERKKGPTGENLLSLLESRLDSVVYRMGFGASRNEARQLVRHNGVNVNGKRVNIPSYTLKDGDEISLTEPAFKQLRVKAAIETGASKANPSWLDINYKDGKGIFKTNPKREDLPENIKENLIVELYSR